MDSRHNWINDKFQQNMPIKFWWNSVCYLKNNFVNVLSSSVLVSDLYLETIDMACCSLMDDSKFKVGHLEIRWLSNYWQYLR